MYDEKKDIDHTDNNKIDLKVYHTKSKTNQKSKKNKNKDSNKKLKEKNCSRCGTN